MNQEFYYKGDLAKYTGKSEILYGGKFFEIVLLEGYLKGIKRWTARCPICGLIDFSIPSHICEVKEANHEETN